MGSIRLARIAGYKPAITPLPIPAMGASNTIDGVITAVHCDDEIIGVYNDLDDAGGDVARERGSTVGSRQHGNKGAALVR